MLLHKITLFSYNTILNERNVIYKSLSTLLYLQQYVVIHDPTKIHNINKTKNTALQKYLLITVPTY